MSHQSEPHSLARLASMYERPGNCSEIRRERSEARGAFARKRTAAFERTPRLAQASVGENRPRYLTVNTW